MITALLIGLIFLLAGFVQGLTGFGSALVAMPLLSLIIDIKTAVPLCMLCSVLITSTLALQLKDHVSLRKILPLSVGSIPGILIGVTLLKAVDSTIIKVMLGLLIAAYSLYSLAVKTKKRRLHPAWSLLAGFLAGAIGAAFSAGGPPVIIYTTLNDWNKHEIKATLTGFFLINSYLVSIVHGLSGVTTNQVLIYFAIAAPLVLTGTLGGGYLFRFMRGSRYRQAISVFLLIMGIIMIVPVQPL